jgi:hypothetical protein
MLALAAVADVARLARAVSRTLMRLAAMRKNVTISMRVRVPNVPFAGSSSW